MKGLVYKSTGNWYDVHTESNVVYKCNIKGKFRSLGIKSTNPVAVGDRVVFEITDEKDFKGLIVEIENRDNYIIRKSVNLSKQTHIIASNIDCCFLFVTPSNPQTSTLFIDRVLVSVAVPLVIGITCFTLVETRKQNEIPKHIELDEMLLHFR